MADDEYNNDGQQDKVCKIYDHDDFFTIFVQLLLAIMALASLYFKRMREVPRRTFRTWFLDISKQAFGACYAHVLNMIIAAIIVHNIRGESELQDQCAWYGMSYLIDTTLGLVLAIGFLRLLDYFAHEHDWVSLKHSGVYVGTEGLKHWFHQVVAWLSILTVVKIIIYFIMLGFSGFLATLGGIIFAPIQFNIRFELVFVMILFPGLLNLIYFWVADHYLKAQKHHKGAHQEDENGEEDEEEDEAVQAPYVAMPWSTLGHDPQPTPKATMEPTGTLA